MLYNQWHIGVHERRLMFKDPYMVTKRRCVWTFPLGRFMLHFTMFIMFLYMKWPQKLLMMIGLAGFCWSSIWNDLHITQSWIWLVSRKSLFQRNTSLQCNELTRWCSHLPLYTNFYWLMLCILGLCVGNVHWWRNSDRFLTISPFRIHLPKCYTSNKDQNQKLSRKIFQKEWHFPDNSSTETGE